MQLEIDGADPVCFDDDCGPNGDLPAYHQLVIPGQEYLIRVAGEPPNDRGAGQLRAECIPCGCSESSAPAAAEGHYLTNRFFSFTAGDPGRSQAVQVVLYDLPAPFEAFEGEVRWVGPPYEVSEISTLPDSTPPTFTVARLQCDPYYTDWSSYGAVRAFGKEVVPHGIYDLRVVDEACDVTRECGYSPVLTTRTCTLWGDCIGPIYNEAWTPPDGRVDFVDISAIVEKFKNEPTAPLKAQVELFGNLPDFVIDFMDISSAVEAFRGFAYPFDGPSECD
jgi:hypothetical protein